MIFAPGTQNPFRHLLAVVVLVGSLLAPGCATVPRVAESRPVLKADLTPVAVELSPREAWHRAEAYAQAHPGSKVMVGRGGSMLPQYEDRTILVVQAMEQSELRQGMTVVFFGDSGRQVAHTLLAPSPRGWVAMGMGNAEPDRTPVRYGNYVGTVIGAFRPRTDLADQESPVVAINGERLAVID